MILLGQNYSGFTQSPIFINTTLKVSVMVLSLPTLLDCIVYKFAQTRKNGCFRQIYEYSLQICSQNHSTQYY